MANEFVIKNGYISQGNSIVNATLSANTIQILTTPTLNNSNTQVLSRNSSTGVVEFLNLSASTTDYYITGGTYSNGILTLDRQNGSVTIVGFLSADTYVTGFTYDNNNKITLSQNNGQNDLFLYINQFSGVSINGLSLPNGYALSVTGDSIFNGDVYVNGDLTYNGNLIVTGGTIIQNGLTANTIYTDYIDFNTGATVTQSQGRISWDSGSGTLNIAVGDTTTGLIDLQVGQEEIVRVFNSEGTTLQKGEIVYVSGSQGNRPAVKRASAVSDGYSVTTLGMVDLAIPSGSEGYVTTFGIISNLNTLGLTGGTPIWLSPTTPGAYTSTKPIGPQHTVLIGYVIRVSATVGSIFVNISNGWELDEIHDVRISGATEGDLLVRSSYSGTPVWVNSKTLNGDYTINGNLTVTSGITTNTINVSTITGLSGDCVTDLFVNNLYGCSPITIHDSIQSYGSFVVVTATTSFAFGNGVQAYGDFSHAEGTTTQALGNASHAEGDGTIASGFGSHSEGSGTQAIGDFSHAEGYNNFATENYSHAEGQSNSASGFYSHSEGTSTVSFGIASHSEGIGTSTGINSAYEGTVNNGLVILDSSYGDVSTNFSNGNDLFLYDSFQDSVYGRAIFTISAVTFNSPSTEIQLEDVTVNTTLARVGDLGYLLSTGGFGGNRIIPADFSHTEGQNTVTLNDVSHTEGYQSFGLGLYSHAEGDHTMAIGNSSHSEGEYTKSIGNYSHSQGGYTKSIGLHSFASGYGSVSSGDTSFVHSTNSVVIGNRSVVLGGQNITGYTDDTVYVSNLNINLTPNLNNSNIEILGRESTSGDIEYRQVNTIGNNYTYVSGSTYSATTTDNVIGVDSSISATTIYLPNSITSGRLRYDIKDIGLNSYNNNITIISSGSDTIISTENSNTVILAADGGALIFFNTGTGTWLQM